jgi:hypothetical protein
MQNFFRSYPFFSCNIQEKCTPSLLSCTNNAAAAAPHKQYSHKRISTECTQYTLLKIHNNLDIVWNSVDGCNSIIKTESLKIKKNIRLFPCTWNLSQAVSPFLHIQCCCRRTTQAIFT